MTEDIRWLTPRMVQAFHQETLHRHGGSDGMRDESLLLSALARPRNRAAYDGDATLFDLAAEYGAGIVGNHPFVDGNKRTGLLASVAFLALNGYRLKADEADIVATIEGLAAGAVDVGALSTWFARNSAPRETG